MPIINTMLLHVKPMTVRRRFPKQKTKKIPMKVRRRRRKLLKRPQNEARKTKNKTGRNANELPTLNDSFQHRAQQSQTLGTAQPTMIPAQNRIELPQDWLPLPRLKVTGII